MFSRILTSALFAGAAAGLIAGLLQLVFVQPVLLHAELYETGKLVHFGGEAVDAIQEVSGIDFTRDGLSIVFTMAVFIGYALLLVAAMALASEFGHITSVRNGFLWGVAGFAAVVIAPGFSLAPEVPGAAAADLYDRQIWWIATVLCAAIAMWFIAFGRSWPLWVSAVVMLFAPHVVGAPEPAMFSGLAPTGIGALFAARSFGVGFTSWVLLGVFATYFWRVSARQSGSRAGE